MWIFIFGNPLSKKRKNVPGMLRVKQVDITICGRAEFNLRKRSQGTTSCGDRSGSRTKVRIAVPLAATCGTLWSLVPWLFDLLEHHTQ